MLPTTDTEPHLNQTLVWQAFAWSRPHPLAHPRPCHLKDIDGANIQAATTNLDAARDASQTASASMQRTRLSSGPCHKLRPPGPCIVLAAPGRPWVSPGIWQAHTESHQRIGQTCCNSSGAHIGQTCCNARPAARRGARPPVRAVPSFASFGVGSRRRGRSMACNAPCHWLSRFA